MHCKFRVTKRALELTIFLSCEEGLSDVENLLDLLWRQECWKAGKSPAADGRHTVSARRRDEALQMQVAQEGTCHSAHGGEPSLIRQICHEYMDDLLVLWIDATVFEHKGTDLLSVNPQCLDSCSSSANEVAHRLMALIRNPHCRELAGP
ncbi:hypothetical protein QO004_002801 [Rhizobium mesoamericanum]|nr:hypothetical protein [Rhizobium mesoamericanum]